MKLHLDSLAPEQRALWDSYASRVPAGWVLYGGTAIALRHGHRMSADFDFFNDEPLDEESLRAALPVLDEARVLRRAPNTLILAVPSGATEVQLWFFGRIDFGRVAEPCITPFGVEIASPLDLLAT